MKAVIGQFYKTARKAVKRVDELRRLWKGKITWYVVEAKNGYFVISEKQARLCYPELDFPQSDRRYKKSF